MNLSLSVAVAIAVGMPGIGYVSTGLLPTHATNVLPIVATSAASFCGLGVIDGEFDVPAIAALDKPRGPDHTPITRSSSLPGFDAALSCALISLAPGMHLF